MTSVGTIEYPVITIDSAGLIEDISSDTAIESEDILTAAFLDVHTHGCANHDVMEGTPAAFDAIGEFLAARGVGRYLATTVTAPVEKTLQSLEGMAGVIEAGPRAGRATPIGIHLEGPFISHAKRGVHPVADIKEPSVALFDRFYAAARGHVRLITIAPETAGAAELIVHCVGLGVRVSLGHSNATAAETLAGVAAGASSATHTFNAMRGMDHREPGILGTVLDADALFAELICDGIHVAPEMVRLWLKMKGEDKAILVTDSISATGMPDGEYMLGGFKVTVVDGRCYATEDLAKGVQMLAGSVLTMDRAVANLQRFTGATLATAVRLASHNPAKLLGVESKIVTGQPASFNCFSAEGQLRSTVLCGVEIRG